MYETILRFISALLFFVTNQGNGFAPNFSIESYFTNANLTDSQNTTERELLPRLALPTPADIKRAMLPQMQHKATPAPVPTVNVVFSYYDPYDPGQSPGHGYTRSGWYATMPSAHLALPMYVAAVRADSGNFGKLFLTHLGEKKIFLYAIDTGGLPLAGKDQVDIAASGGHISFIRPYTSWQGNLRFHALTEIANFGRNCRDLSKCSLPSPKEMQQRILRGDFDFALASASTTTILP